MNKREKKLTELELHIDALGRLQAEQRRLEERCKGLKAAILADMQELDLNRANGRLFSVIRVVKTVKRVNWKDVAAKLLPSRQLIAAHTSVGTSEYVQLSTRKADAA